MTTLTGRDDPLARDPTMRDVAALAGVSIKTVSRVVNREAGVSAERAARVLDAIGLLGYRHNVIASNLRRADRKTATIGLVLEDVANPFSSALHRAIEEMARSRHTLVFAGSCDEDRLREQELLLALISRRVDGLIVLPVAASHPRSARVRRPGPPIVYVDRPPPGGSGADADSVTVDNRGGARWAVSHLAAHGHRRIAFLGDLHAIWTATERHLGYLDGLAAAGLPLDPRLVRQDIRGTDPAERAARDLLALPDPPTAVFAAQNLLTIGVIRALQHRNLQRQIALVGFDDLLLGDLLAPPVTVVAQDPTAIGRAAADLLFRRLDGDHTPPRHLIIPTHLIPRGSGEIPASTSS